jgi:DNA-binding PadR family transcriptional regulator
MNTLEQNGFIKSINTSNPKRYQVTEKGLKAYGKWAKDFLDFARSNNGICMIQNK